MFYKVEKPEKGDLIRVRREGGYYHFGVVVSEDSVVHFSDIGGDFGANDGIAVRETSLSVFQQKGEIEAENHDKSPYEQVEIVERARSYIGSTTFRDRRYNLLTNNCEHFARYIFNGIAESNQMTDGSIAITSAVKTAAGTAVKVIKKKITNVRKPKTTKMVKR